MTFEHEDDAPWRRKAACLGLDYLYFPERGEGTRAAKEICAECPVSTECFNYALTTNPPHGIWGGKTYNERKTWQRRQKRRAS